MTICLKSEVILNFLLSFYAMADGHATCATCATPMGYRVACLSVKAAVLRSCIAITSKPLEAKEMDSIFCLVKVRMDSPRFRIACCRQKCLLI